MALKKKSTSKVKKKATPPAAEMVARYVTQKRLAEILDVSEVAVHKLATATDFKRNDKGEIDIYDVLYHLVKKRMTTEADEYQEQRLRKIKAEADMAEHDLQIARREVVPIAEAVEFVKKQLSPIATAIKMLPSRLCGLCVGLDDARVAEEIITGEVDKCLAKIRGE